MIQDDPTPYALTGSYADAANDSEVTLRDDYLTAAWRLRAEFTRYYVTAGYEMMTWKAAKRRTDEAEALAGPVFRYGNLTVRTSVGVLADGQLGGQAVQNWWHRTVTGSRELGLRYEAMTWHPAVEAEATYTLAPAQVHVTAAGTDRGWQASAMVRIGGEAGCIGVGWSVFRADVSPTARRVGETMEGPKVTVGGIGAPNVAAGLTFSGRTALLNLGAAW